MKLSRWIVKNRLLIYRADHHIVKKALYTTAVLMALVLCHSLAMMGFEGLEPWPALWLTLTTLTTVGYGDLSAQTQHGQMATIILIYFGGITLMTFLIRDYVDYRIARNERIRNGFWDWKMENHILIINSPKYNNELFFKRLVMQIREDKEYKNVPILLLNSEFQDGLPAQLKDLDVRHITGSGNDDTDLNRAHAGKSKHILVLARDEYNADSDSISFDIAYRLHSMRLAHLALVECVEDSNRKRITDLGIKSVSRPIRSYPELLVRAMDAPGSEVVIEDMFTRKDNHPERYSIWLEGERWADVVSAMVQAGVGTPMAFINKEGEVTVHPAGDDHIHAQSLIILVKSANVPSQKQVDAAFEKSLVKLG